MDSKTEIVDTSLEKHAVVENESQIDSNHSIDANYTSRGTLEYMWQTGRVLKEKAWSALWKFDLFQKVDRVYPKESYYGGIFGITTQPATRIIDNIWIGSAFNAADYRWLKNEEIDLIVNITSDISNYYPEEFGYINYYTEDLETGGVSEFLDDFVQFVRLNAESRIFVHCFAGKSRSASLVLYYLIQEKNMSFNHALDYLKEKRPNININCRFLEEIKEKINNTPYLNIGN